MSRWALAFGGLWIVVAASTASAQTRAPTRGDFVRAVLELAASEVPPDGCEEVARGRPRAIELDDRAIAVGRRLSIDERRLGWFVRVATGDADANGDLAYALHLVVLTRSDDRWTFERAVAIPLGDASFVYDTPVVRVARLEDVDDDGERELVAVLETNTETFCGPGYCTVRRSVVLDVADPAIPLIANVESARTCQSDLADQVTGTVQFRDADGDRHRDLVTRTRTCPGASDRDPPGVRCGPARERVHRWLAATDRYEGL